ncbi:iron-containing alcohol dehydrogenase [Ureibacillus sp. FSL K6-8385]|uniref:Iron-containing alcohol dehydrogenase n=1 Tax=Ureibacillus terrenus TaxID=118246 RepID=A0A540V0G6_9BACL|nr:iron-containing alcohol dehydrogenase [Ureibacillus terrenus]MED3764874.1 iron-containing alcohol dehydrogenase [Ureibacillus terrenus]TQE90234.1 iron-containing alcohol dehydrogenase [Ureibacillus terrenus]
MNNFTFSNPVRLYFGKGEIIKLKKELPKYGRNVLLVYGGGSIKRNGIYDEVISILKELDLNVFELSGVEPNPRVETARKGIDICKRESIDFVLAVGGGSVIDCSKLIAAGAKHEEDPWKIVTNQVHVKDALPLGTVITLAATGSEMNANSVITNGETEEKYGWSSGKVYPKFSILDPAYTITVPKEQTVYGIVDMMSHVFEQYFHNAKNTLIMDELCEGVLRTVIETAPKLLEDLENYELRETILLSGTIALNGMLSMGSDGDWATHQIEHAVSAVYDIPHGGGLAILFPNWMKHVVHVNPDRFARLAAKVFQVDPSNKSAEEVAYEGIERLRAFWTSLGAPSRLKDYGIDDSKLDVLVEKAMANGPIGRFKVLQESDVREIYKMSL